MTFTQTLTVQAGSADQLTELLREWHRDQAGAAPGYHGARVLSDRAQQGRYVIEVEFTSASDAQKNNDRPETQSWATGLRKVAEADPEYRDYDVVFTTGS